MLFTEKEMRENYDQNGVKAKGTRWKTNSCQSCDQLYVSAILCAKTTQYTYYFSEMNKRLKPSFKTQSSVCLYSSVFSMHLTTSNSNTFQLNN